MKREEEKEGSLTSMAWTSQTKGCRAALPQDKIIRHWCTGNQQNCLLSGTASKSLSLRGSGGAEPTWTQKERRKTLHLHHQFSARASPHSRTEVKGKGENVSVCRSWKWNEKEQLYILYSLRPESLWANNQHKPVNLNTDRIT